MFEQQQIEIFCGKRYPVSRTLCKGNTPHLPPFPS